MHRSRFRHDVGHELELPRAIAAWCCPGLGRKDEVGDHGAGVETFKGKGRQKARAEGASQDDDAGISGRRAAQEEMINSRRLLEVRSRDLLRTVSSARPSLGTSDGTLTAYGRAVSQELTTMVRSASEKGAPPSDSRWLRDRGEASSVNEISRQVQTSASICQRGGAARTQAQ